MTVSLRFSYFAVLNALSGYLLGEESAYGMNMIPSYSSWRVFGLLFVVLTTLTLGIAFQSRLFVALNSLNRRIWRSRC